MLNTYLVILYIITVSKSTKIFENIIYHNVMLLQNNMFEKKLHFYFFNEILYLNSYSKA